MNQIPCLVVGCEISNLGAKAGAVDDMLLIAKYRQEKPKTQNKYSFLPLFTKDSYNVFVSYEEKDFEPFQSIFVPDKSNVIKYVVFNPSAEGFSPSAGEIELQLFARMSENEDWQEAIGNATIVLDDDLATVWRDPNGKSLMTESIGNNKFRDKLLQQVFH